MDTVWNPVIYLSIASIYNILVHNVASFLYKDQQYDEKNKSVTTFIIIAGIFAIVVAKLIEDKDDKHVLVVKGMTIGGILLLITVLLVNWENITEEIKIISMMGIFGCILWYAFNKKNKQNDKINKISTIQKHNVKESDDPINEDFTVDF